MISGGELKKRCRPAADLAALVGGKVTADQQVRPTKVKVGRRCRAAVISNRAPARFSVRLLAVTGRLERPPASSRMPVLPCLGRVNYPKLRPDDSQA